MSFNKIILVGHLGRNPELRFTAQNVPVCTFSVATTERKKSNVPGQPGEETTTWFRVTFWREKAELANKYLAKGNQVYVEGRLATREWEDREGVTRTSLEVTGTELHFIDNKAEGQGKPRTGRDTQVAGNREVGQEPAIRPTGEGEESDLNEDDIPF